MSEPSARQRAVLLALCREYVVSGRPVASGTLCRSGGLEWSSATVRNELAALERLGLVHKPHAASGRIPSPEGWRIYVDELPRSDARPEHQRLVDVSLGDTGDPRVGLRTTARVLSEIAGCVAIGFLGEPRPGVVRALELVPLAGGSGLTGGDDARILVMLGLDDGASSVRTVACDRELLAREGELRRLQDVLRDLTLGRTLGEARERLRELLTMQEQRVDRLVAEALRIGLMLCVMTFDPLWMQVAGHTSLPAWAGGAPGGDLRRKPSGPHGAAGSGAGGGEPDSVADILALLEDYQRLAEILYQLLPEPEAEPRASVRVDLSLDQLDQLGQLGQLGGSARGMPLVGVFSELPRPVGLTLVGCRMRWPTPAGSPATRTGQAPRAGGAVGAVALLGSPRMDYEAVIPLVEYAARAMAARA
jgi:heat-inducible transcriptional repressor